MKNKSLLTKIYEQKPLTIYRIKDGIKNDTISLLNDAGIDWKSFKRVTSTDNCVILLSHEKRTTPEVLAHNSNADKTLLQVNGECFILSHGEILDIEPMPAEYAQKVFDQSVENSLKFYNKERA